MDENRQDNLEEINGSGPGDSFNDVSFEDSLFIDFEALLRSDDLEAIADKILSGALAETDFMKKDFLDKFLDFIYFKVQTGYLDIISMAYPSRRMTDKELEKKVIEIVNEHLYPEIVLRILKYFTRQIHDPDSNLYIANLITSEKIITSIFETYRLFRKDIFIRDPDKRSLNVKRIQQFSSRSDNRLSSPLDAAARLKYILEFLALKYNLQHLYTPEDLLLLHPEASGGE